MPRLQTWIGLALLASSVVACAGKTTSRDGTPSGGATAGTNPCTPTTEPSLSVTAAGITSDGHYVVFASQGSTTRVFYGTPDHMTEGRFTGQQNSCAVELDFTVGDTSYGAVFAPSSCKGVQQSRLGLSGKDGEGRMLPMTVLVGFGAQPDAGTALSPAELTYFCF